MVVINRVMVMRSGQIWGELYGIAHEWKKIMLYAAGLKTHGSA